MEAVLAVLSMEGGEDDAWQLNSGNGMRDAGDGLPIGLMSKGMAK